MTTYEPAQPPADQPVAPVDLAKPAEPAPAPAGPVTTPIGTLRQVPVTGPGGVTSQRWGIVTDSRAYTYQESGVGPDGQPATVTKSGVQDTVELLSGNSLIVEH